MSSSSSVARGGDPAKERGRWRGQQPGATNPLEWLRRNRAKLLWSALLIAAVALFAWLIWLLRYAPLRTPLVVFSSAPYSWPLPPNDWAAEDLDHLSLLDSQSVTLFGVDQPLRTKADFLDRFDQAIGQRAAGTDDHPLIFWISMHGVTDRLGGNAYLIPSQGSPTEPDTWISVEELLKKLGSLPPQCHTLLILDCHRLQVNWNIGLLANDFSEQVSKEFAKHELSNVAILMAAASEQQAAVSADLRGSVFAHYVRQGLAGAADRDTRSGNSDQWVSLSELTSFVQRHVEDWVIHNRGRRQNPELVRIDNRQDFQLTRSLRPSELDRALANDARTSRPMPVIPSEQLDRLWTQLDTLGKQNRYRQEPIAWRNLEHRMLWLEQLANSGEGYRAVALRTLGSMEQQLQRVANRTSRLQQSRHFADHCAVLSGDAWKPPTNLSLHNLPLIEYFGSLDTEVSDQLRARLNAFHENPQAGEIMELVSLLESEAKVSLEASHFLRMVDRYQHPNMVWSRQLTEGPPPSPSSAARLDIQSLLGLQQRIERLTVPQTNSGEPSDGRMHGWTRALLQQVDRARRFDEDRLFVQGPLTRPESIADTATLVDQASSANRTLQQMIQNCDRAMAVTPYLANWTAHPLRRQQPAQTSAAINLQILPLITSIAQWSSDLATPSPLDRDLTSLQSEISALQAFGSEQVEQPLATLIDAWNVDIKQLLADAESDQPAIVGELQAALAIPLADADQRQDLRRARRDLIMRLHQQYDHGAITSSVTEPDATSEVSYSSQFTQWQQHPLLAILGIDQQSSDANRNPIQIMLGDVVQRLTAQQDTTSLLQQRTQCASAARQLRMAAPIWFTPPQPNPIMELRRIDMRSLLVWHTNRALDDFWGPAGQEIAFFDIAASDYLSASARFSQSSAEIQPTAPVEIATTASRLAETRRLAPNWLRTDAATETQLDRSDPVQSSVTVTATPKTILDSLTGTATVYVGHDAQRQGSVKSLPTDAVGLPPYQAGLTIELPPELIQRSPKLTARTMFRGHEYGIPLNIEKLAGITVITKPHRYQRSDVTLSSPWDKLSVAFVLDCSQSMGNSLITRAEDGAVLSRADIAKLALQEMLFELGLRENVRAAVLLFGNRLGWSTDTPVRPLTRPGFVGEIGPDTTPSQDVQSLLSLRELDLAAAQSVIPQVNAAMPWGQSPLYLATVRALQEFGPDDRQSDRHVIAITDGANYQFVPPSEVGVAPTTDDDVRAVWSGQRVPVHILGLNMDRNRDQAAMEEFRQLCTDTGGHFQDLTTTDLSTALSQLLRTGRYRLTRADAEATLIGERPLGRGLTLPASQFAREYWLTFDGRQYVDQGPQSERNIATAIEPLRLLGGEALQLYVSESGDKIFAYPYDTNVAAQADLVTASAGWTDHVVRVHQPQLDVTGHVTIPLSWQQREPSGPSGPGPRPRWRVTGRPAAMWVEIQPLTAGGSRAGQPYVFYDANYEPKRPVPVVDLVARDWPELATTAQIRLWCQPSHDQPIRLHAADQTPASAGGNEPMRLDFADAKGQSIPINFIPGVTLRVEQLPKRLRFILDFSKSDAPPTAVRLDLPSDTAAQPSLIHRQYDPRLKLAVHTYDFDSDTLSLPPTVELSDPQSQQQRSWHLQSDWLNVDVSQSGMYLPVNLSR